MHDQWWRHRHERRAVPDPAWIARCSAWLQRPRGVLGPAAWLVLLQPEHLDGALRLPNGTLHASTVVAWAAPPTGGPVDCVIEPAWVAPRGRGTEVAIDVRARQAGVGIAASRGVFRLPGRHDPLGERVELRRPPVPATTRRRARLTLDGGQVEEFAAISDTHDRIHDDPGYARRQGFRGGLVQGGLLAATVMHHARAGASGAARFWFRRPVSAGTLLRLESTGPDDGRSRWWIRKTNDEVAVIAELEASDRSGTGRAELD